MLGLMLTGVLTRHPVRGMTFFRTALFLPQTIAGVVVAQAFVWFYALDGPFNRVARAGRARLAGARGWLGDFDWALTFVGAIGTWVTFGLCMVLFIAGAQKIPTSLYDAARVDGAGAVREFFAVTLPGLRNELVVAFVLTTINALRSFDLVYNATSGGPGNETYVPSLLHVPERVPVQPGRLLLRDRGAARDRDLRPSRSCINLLAERGRRGVKSSPLRARRHLLGADRVRGDGALPDPLDPLPRAAQEDRPRHRLRVPDPSRLSSCSRRPGPGRRRRRTRLRKLFTNSFIVAGAVTVVSAVLSIGTGYAFGTMRFRGDRIVFPIVLLGIIFPYEATVIPLYYDFQRFDLPEHLLGADPAPDRPVGRRSARSGCARSSAARRDR